MKAYVPCRAVRYTASFVQKKTPFLLVADGGQDDDMTSKSTPCHTLEADYIAQAVKAMFLNLTNKCMMLLYTGEILHPIHECIILIYTGRVLDKRVRKGVFVSLKWDPVCFDIAAYCPSVYC